MAITWKITDGTDTVDLASGAGFQGRDSGSTTIKGLLPGQIAQEIRVNLMPDTTHDSVATKFQTLWKLLNRARLYSKTDWQGKPVYLEQKLDGETGTRYSMLVDVPDFEQVELLGFLLKERKAIADMSIVVVREHPWGSQAPGTTGSAITLKESNGPATPTKVHIANFRDDGDVTHIYHYDLSTTTFSANLISAGNGTALFPAAPAAGDYLYFGSTDIAFKHVCLQIATAGDHVWIVDLEYYNGADWTTALTFGTDYTLFAAAGGVVDSENSIFEQAGLWSINLFPPSDWAKVAINGQTCYWIRFNLTTVTSTTTLPTKNADTIYSQRINSVEIPAASLKGDSPALSLTRLWAPSGGGTTVSKANLSRALVGAKSETGTVDLDDFEPMLNCGNADNPAAWTTTYGDDTTATADTRSPGGSKANCDFGTDSTMVKRVTLLGDNLLEDYVGEYRLLVGCQQTGGDAGDAKLKGRIFVGGKTDTDPHADTREKATRGVDQGIEVVDLGLIRFPLNRSYNADSLVNVDVAVEIHSERLTGTSTIAFDWVYLMPVREGSVGIDDPVLDTSVGSSALRGGSVFDIDAGVIADRNQHSIYDGTNLLPIAGEWGRFNRPIDFENVGVRTKLYFLMLHFAVGNSWNTDPLIASPGCHLACEIFMNFGYGVLRGAG